MSKSPIYTPDSSAGTAELGSSPTAPEANQAEAPRSTSHACRWLVATIVLGYLAQLGLRLWLCGRAAVPVAHADEDGYLLAARALFGGAGGFSTENSLFRRVGYPILLAPLYAGTDDPFLVYRRAQILSAAVSSLAFPLGILFARRVLALPAAWAVGVAMAVSTLPATVYYSGMVMTDAILPAVTIGWLLLLYLWVSGEPRGPGFWYAVSSGAAAGLMSAIHIRGSVIAILHLLLTGLLLVSRRVRWTAAGLSSIAAVLAASLDLLGKWVIGDAIVLVGTDPGSQISGAFTASSSILIVLERSIGQLWYLAIGTLGLGAVGVIAAVSSLFQLRRRSSADQECYARRLVLTAVLVVTVLVAVGSAASLSFAERRITYYAYPRYLHFLYPIWFFLGFAELRDARRNGLTLARRVVSASALTLICGVVVRAVAEDRAGAPFIAFDAPELLALSGQWERFTVVAPTLVALAGFVAIALGLSRRVTAPLTLVAVTIAGVVAAPAIDRRIIAPMVAYQYPPGTPQLVRDLGLGPSDVVATAFQVPFPYMYNHAREVYWHRIEVFDAAGPPPSRATVVIAPWYGDRAGAFWDGTPFGMHPIATAPQNGWAVWRRSS